MARAFFGAYVVPPNASHIVVLDIDETALSNEMPRIGQAWDDWDWGLRPGQQVNVNPKPCNSGPLRQQQSLELDSADHGLLTGS